VADIDDDSEEELLELSAAGVITTGVDLSGRYSGPLRPQPEVSAASAKVSVNRNILTPA
jgi:hypothetical protein